MVRSILSLAAATLLTGSALAQGNNAAAVTDGNSLGAAPTEWLGDTPHFVMIGTVEGYTFDVQFLDVGMSADIATFEGKREYVETAGGFAYRDFEFVLEAVIGGEERAIEIEAENDDFGAFDLPSDFALQDGEFPVGALSNMEIEFEWEIGGVSTEVEVAGWSGTLTLAVDAGEADDKGLSASGVIAGFIDATRGEDHVVISFTVPVAEYEIDD